MSNYFFKEDANFVAGDSPKIIDVTTEISSNNGFLCLKNDGPGDILLSLSLDGTTYGDDIRIKSTEYKQCGLPIKKIKITHTGTDSAYRLYSED